jgi:hypothetical protein
MFKMNDIPILRSQLLKIIVVFILCTVSKSVQASMCFELFSKNVATEKTVRSSTKDIEVPLYSYITPQNIDSIFSHNYRRTDRDRFGCKAIVTKVPGQSVRVYFFPTGSGTKNWNIHHLDALSSALGVPADLVFPSYVPYVQGYQLTAYKVYGRWTVTQLEISSTLVYWHEMGPDYKPSRELDTEMLEALTSHIDENLRHFPIPSIN